MTGLAPDEASRLLQGSAAAVYLHRGQPVADPQALGQSRNSRPILRGIRSQLMIHESEGHRAEPPVLGKARTRQR